MSSEDADPQRSPRSSAWRLLPIGLILLATLTLLAFGVHRYLSFEQLARHREVLLAWRDQHALSAVLAFIGTYALSVALSLPGAIWFTIVGGFLFGVVGSIYSVLAATLGACAIFVAARHIVGNGLRKKAGAAIRRMETGFREHAFSYLLVLRLLPIFPFWLINLVPAFLGVPLGTFALGTLLGIIPLTVVYTLLGNGLGAIMDAGGEPNLGIIFEPQVLGPIFGLALLALAPLLYRRLRASKARSRRLDEEPRGLG